ncbi:MAG TPA: N-acetylglucosamine kinase, partial [Bacteroidia bacterium]|nr:N-acetylglucosamine kinase [Bacteroidia bacterium]
NQKISQFSTIGFNPYFISPEKIILELKNNFLPQLPSKLFASSLQLFFYGSGCSSEDKCNEIKSALQTVFSKATIEVHHDLLGAARGACGHQEGIAAILGTGSNSCHYSGSEILENRTALGYILGDEGSGSHIGKTFIKAYLDKELPSEIEKIFFERYHLTKEKIFDSVYSQPMPNKFLASFAKFVFQNNQHIYCSNLVANCFEAFFDKHICKYAVHKKVKLSCVGSVGFYNSNILRAVAQNKGVNIDRILENPIAGLTLYHLEK